MLERTHFYCHLDVEKDGKLESLRLRNEWDQCFSHRDAGPLWQRLGKLGMPTVIDWGFPIHCLPIVELFKSVGMSIWWFDADPSTAREAFVKRNGMPGKNLDAQIESILDNWDKIERVFGAQIIRTLEANGTRLPPEAILKRIEEAFL